MQHKEHAHPDISVSFFFREIIPTLLTQMGLKEEAKSIIEKTANRKIDTPHTPNGLKAALWKAYESALNRVDQARESSSDFSEEAIRDFLAYLFSYEEHPEVTTEDTFYTLINYHWWSYYNSPSWVGARLPALKLYLQILWYFTLTEGTNIEASPLLEKIHFHDLFLTYMRAYCNCPITISQIDPLSAQ